MSIEVGAKLSGKVSGITDFGAFVDLGDKKTGLVHISEVSNTFVKDIHEVLSVGDEVTVKVLSVSDDGKIGLSIKKAVDKPQKQNNQRRNNNHEQHNNRDKVKKNHNTSFKPKHEEKKDFDSLLAGFLKESEDRLTSLKRNTEGKRGGRGGRRS
mgnify:CR=1 FL=1